MPQAYEVHSYSITILCRLLAEKANTDQHLIDQKQHRVYLENYFNTLVAQTIVVESDYTDRDFLEDFAGYYVRCFHNYPRRCARLHFFSLAFDEANFSSLLSGESSSINAISLQEAYLGFMVVKPLPRTVIGRTCLQTYPTAGRRTFPVTHPYPVNLFGLPLSIQSLAFQEQDSVAAACATSALWSAFHATHIDFQHHIPSPVEITRAATSHVPLTTRTFPNSSGLNATQMADAIRSVGLEPYLLNASNEYVLKSTLYAYLRGKIPIIMIIDLYDPAVVPHISEELHAVTVAGYSIGQSQPVPFGASGFLLRASRMDKIYVHDDQIGPFARMEAVGGANFNTSWRNNAQTGTLNAKAEMLLIPLYHKIRIGFETILGMVFEFDGFMEVLRLNQVLSFTDRLEWDIYLTDVNTVKSELQTSSTLSGSQRRDVAVHPMPRFIWRATALAGNNLVLDLLFDATDIEQGVSFVCAVEYDAAAGQALRSVAPIMLNLPDTNQRSDRRILSWFSNPPF